MSVQEEYIKNAVINSVSFSDERGLGIFVELDYGGSIQGFGGFGYYNCWDDSWKKGPNYLGRFIWRMLKITGVHDLKHIVGKSVRVKLDSPYLDGNILAVGHIIKDDWFSPREEFAPEKQDAG